MSASSSGGEDINGYGCMIDAGRSGELLACKICRDDREEDVDENRELHDEERNTTCDHDDLMRSFRYSSRMLDGIAQ